jgi:hypothetical protein
MLRCLLGVIISAALGVLAAGCSRQTCEVEETRTAEVDPLTESFQVYTQVDSPADADFMVVVEYEVPQVTKDSQTLYFKRNIPTNVAYLDDGTIKVYGCGGGRCMGSCADGGDGYCNTFLLCDATEKGIEVELSIRWGGKTEGRVEEKASIPWAELPK